MKDNQVKVNATINSTNEFQLSVKVDQEHEGTNINLVKLTADCDELF